MDERITVSIITPTYNHEGFISQCIESVLAQTYPHWEQIIIDDGSTDRTGEIVCGYDDNRIRYIRQENKGIWRLGELYNKALECSKGELIAVLEGDDFWPARKLERQIPELSHPDVVLSWGKACLTNYQGKPIQASPNSVQEYMNLSRNENLKKVLFRNPIPSPTVMCKKSAIDLIGGFRQPQGLPYVDLPTWLDLCLVGDFLAIDEIIGCYRRHGRQITATMKESVNAGRTYPIKFFMQLPEEIKQSIGITAEDLLNHIDRVNSELFYQSGRASLFEGKWSQARGKFKEALLKGGPTTRMKAVAGLACSYCRTDVEWLAAITGEMRLDEQT